MRGLPMVALVILIWLSGCAAPYSPTFTLPTLPKPTPEQTALWKKHRDKAVRIAAWQLRGRMAVSAGNDRDTKRTGNSSLIWEYQPEQQEMELYGPFGSGRVKITEQSGNALLTDPKGKTTEADTIQKVLYKRLGWHVPFAELQYWVRGIPAGTTADSITEDTTGDAAEIADDTVSTATDYADDTAVVSWSIDDEDAPKFSLDAQGRLHTLRQGDWTVEYKSYQTINQIELPYKISLKADPFTIAIYSEDGEYIGNDVRVILLVKDWLDLETVE